MSFTTLPPRFHLAFLKDTQAEEISNKLSNLRTAEKTRARKIQDIEANIRKMQAEMAPRDVENMEDIEEEIVRSFTLLPNASFQRARYSAALHKLAVARVSASSSLESNSSASLRTNREPRLR